VARLTGRAAGYRTVLRTPGLPLLVATGFAGGVAAQGSGLALVLLAREATGSFARAGAMLAAATLGGLVFSPARARLVDRRGAGRVLPLLGVLSTGGTVAFVVAAHEREPIGLLVALAFASAACTPPLNAVLRTLWRELLPEGAARHAGFGLMTVMQEVTFFTGPLVAGAVLGLASAEAAVLALAGLGLAATLAFAASPAARAHGREASDQPRTRLGALALPGVRTLAATGALAGAAFGLLDVALPATARHGGSPETAGVLLSAIALGIGVGGFVYGMVPPRRPAGWLYGPLCGLAAIGLAPLAVAGGHVSLAVLTALLVLTGLLFAPLTTCQIALIDDVAPRHMTTEAFAVLGVAYGTASAIGAQAAGALVDGPGLRAPFVAAFGCVALAAGVAIVRRRTLLRAHATIDAA
jgi:MFS family permease